MNEALTQCKHCGSTLCNQTKFEDGNIAWFCISCGFHTSTLMVEGTDTMKQVLENAPELYLDISFKDEDGKTWFPATITIPGKGMVFVDGTSRNDWGWKSVKAVYVPEEERHMYPEGNEYRMDMSNAKLYDKKDFMNALENIDFYNQ